MKRSVGKMDFEQGDFLHDASDKNLSLIDKHDECTRENQTARLLEGREGKRINLLSFAIRSLFAPLKKAAIGKEKDLYRRLIQYAQRYLERINSTQLFACRSRLVCLVGVALIDFFLDLFCEVHFDFDMIGYRILVNVVKQGHQSIKVRQFYFCRCNEFFI